MSDDELEALYTEHAARLQTFLYRRLRGDEAARDLASDVWLRFVERMREGYVLTGPPLAFLYHLGRQRAADYRRWRWVRAGDRRVGDDDEGPGCERHAAARADADRAMRALNERERSVVVCRFWYGLSRDETATMLRLTATTVKDTQERAMSRMRRALEVVS